MGAAASGALLLSCGTTFDPPSKVQTVRIIAVTKEKLVSSDLNHDPSSATIALDQTKVMDGNFVRVVAWYDNEWGFSNRMGDTALAMSRLG